MSTTALCLQHVPFEGPGVFEQALGDLGFALTRRLVPVEDLPTNLPDFLLVMGGPMSANDPDAWIADELAFIRRTVEAGVPFLGICLGSQLLAKAMGGRVYKGPGIEIGMTRVELTDAGRSDPLFKSAPTPLDVFEWHGEGIEAPPGATVLASSALFPVQAFRCGAKALGLLFHAELEESGIRALCEKCPEDAAKAGLDAKAILAAAKPHLPGLHRWAGAVVRGL
jgi:GMP synthase (glutamine-hydrolysing)